MSRQTIKLTLTLLAMLAAACSGDRAQPSIQRQLALTSFESCESLEQYIEDTAVQQMRIALEPVREIGGLVPLAAGAATRSDATATQESAPNGYTRTNTQVDGVDEADIVKTNGTHIFALAGSTLHIAKSWPAEEMALQATLRLEGYPREMFLEEGADRVTVLSAVHTNYATTSGFAPASDYACFAWGCGGRSATKVTIIDVSDTTAPTVTAEHYLPGWYDNSRRVGTSLRLVLNDSFDYPEDVRWWPEGSDSKRAFRKLMDRNEAAMRARTLDEWLPKTRRRNRDGSMNELSYQCTDFAAPNAPVQLGLATIATIDLAEPTDVHRTSIVATTSEIYATPESLYLAERHWWWFQEADQTNYTYVFKFDIREPKSAALVAAGGFEGNILNQFSMDEYEGNLRVATTITRTKGDNDDWRIETSNRVIVLDPALGVIGQTKPLAEGESIYSARFIGERGFVVTFRQIDPLFTLDLSNPRQPEVLGELKVPGFSTYLHPLDANHLLAIGIDLPDPNDNGFAQFPEQRMKLTIFDVTDLRNPREKFTQLVGTAYSWSDALYEHKAFNYFAETGMLAIPFTDWQSWETGDRWWTTFVSQVRVFHIDVDAGITSKGALDMYDVYRTTNDNIWSPFWSPWVRRSVMADDYVYAISDAGIRAGKIEDAVTPVSTIRFDRDDNIGR